MSVCILILVWSIEDLTVLEAVEELVEQQEDIMINDLRRQLRETEEYVHLLKSTHVSVPTRADTSPSLTAAACAQQSSASL